ncbi:acyl-CoA thioesterase [Frigoriflavimonas asaccharolytica]|uniref:Acyl-CoA thioester hydrolase n=1 Tax=Frigoriflavimonas asaccharolytica TaxID=2735899 RepID=A0A8J8G4C5_9FLAO|nr:acyl-CoA thioesterase [Frigoriflavimonas asaccharolytica]NRS90938.1 acyl-CoA thioester hydrolase [Frigoriflavimonas asaccharolytica]
MEKEIASSAKIRFSDCDPIGHLNNVKYIEYMLNAREDHVESFYGFTYEEYSRKTGCTWITIQNEIAYLKEVRYNAKVVITSKTIEVSDRISKIEILMKSEDEKTINAVLWINVIYFNMKTRASEIQPEDVKELFKKYLVSLDQKDFKTRSEFLRRQNKSVIQTK